VLVAAAVASTWLGVVAVMAALLAGDGVSALDGLMLLAFAGSTPMVALGFWNAAIGSVLLARHRDPAGAVMPLRRDGALAPGERVALVMPVYNEDPEQVFRHLGATAHDLDRTGLAGRFDVVLLSDTTDPAIRAAEDRYMAAWRALDRDPDRLTLRRRQARAGFKAGNIRAFVDAPESQAYTYMVVLDADSVMRGPAIERLVGTLAANPGVGIVQALAVGLPAQSAFARIFQFGMRHGMLPHTLGAAWWHGDAGPYWGHNAALRMTAFRAACRLPTLPGRSPLAGAILSHDQVEAAQMRAHGYGVRVLALEDGSYEANPPTLPDFIKRDLRWCQGNLQYLKLLARPGFRFMGRLQLTQAVGMYLAAPCWLAFVVLGVLQLSLPATAATAPLLDGSGVALPQAAWGVGLLATMLGMTFAPKLLGYAHALLDRGRRRAFGGARRVFAGMGAEIAASLVLGPVVMVAQSVFMAGLPFGRTVAWGAQARGGRRVPWRMAWRGLWPQTALGLLGTGVLALKAPALLPWAAPMLAAWLLAVPFAVLTAHPVLGRACERAGLCATPEERAGMRLATELPRPGGGGPVPVSEAPGAPSD